MHYHDQNQRSMIYRRCNKLGVSVSFQSTYLVASLSCKITTTPSSAGHIGHRAPENSTLTYDLANLLTPFGIHLTTMERTVC